MSDYLAAGGVSAVLCSLLTTALTNGGPSTILGSSPPGITANSPDLITTGNGEHPRLNLFMYYASLNPALRNLDLPSTDSGGGRLSNPPLALNLHYLLTAYGSSQFDPEILLAWAMQVFHETPVVPRQTIQDALTNLLSQSSPEAKLIGTSTLANQIEHIRITPETLTTEEIYRLWTAFQTHYRPTTSYQVSVVVIQSTQSYTSNLPVQRRSLVALPLQSPVIENLTPSMVAVGQVLTINGSNFVGDSAANTLVSFDFGAGINPDTLQGNCIRVTLPPNLQAGTRTVRVERLVTFPSSSTPHSGFNSSPAPFQLIPTITTASPLAATQGASLVVGISPPVGRTQRAVLYIGDGAIPIDERPVTDPATSTTLTFPIAKDFPLGTFPIRIEIDGAQSKLTPNSTGQFLPQVKVSP